MENQQSTNLHALFSWVELFVHLKNNDIPFIEFSRLVEFVLCLPRTNAIVECIFSEVTHRWKKESSQLKIETLKSILAVTVNLDYTCIEFFDLSKTNDTLLKQIGSSRKYDNKNNENPSTSDEIVDLNMSIE